MKNWTVPFPGCGRYNRYPDESGPADQDKTDDAYWEGDDE